MKKVYVTPEIEYDDFSLDEVVCANLYGSPKSRSVEFYAVGRNNVGLLSDDETDIGDGGGEFDD